MKLSKEIPYRNNMDLGVGFDDLTGETRDIIFEYSSIKPTNGLAGRGQSGRFIMKRVDTTEDLMSALNINVDIDGRYKLFGGGNEFDFVDKTKFNSQSTFLVARVDIQKAEKQFFEAKVKKLPLIWLEQEMRSALRNYMAISMFRE